MKVSKLKQAFQAFNDALTNSEEEQSFMDGVLADGTIVRWEGELAEGIAVMKITEEGEVSLEDGTFVLEDGTSFEMVGGLVAAVVPVEMEEEGFDSDAFKAEILEAVDAKLAEFKEGFATNEKVEEMTTQLAEKVSAMADEVLSAFEKEPTPLNEPKQTIKNDKVAKAVAMASALRNKK